MTIDFRQLMARQELLPDAYELVGRRRLDPDYASLATALAEAAEHLAAEQSQIDTALQARAAAWLHALTDLVGVFRDPERRREYETTVIAELTQKYSAGAGADPHRWVETALARWLSMVQNVAPTRITEVARNMAIVATRRRSAAAAATPPGIPTNPIPPGTPVGRQSWRQIAEQVRPATGVTISPGARPAKPTPTPPPIPVSKGTTPLSRSDDLPTIPLASESLWTDDQLQSSGPASYSPPPTPVPQTIPPPNEQAIPWHAYPPPPATTAPAEAPVSPPNTGRMSSTEQTFWIVGAVVFGLLIPVGLGIWFLWSEHQRSNSILDAPLPAVSSATVPKAAGPTATPTAVPKASVSGTTPPTGSRSVPIPKPTSSSTSVAVRTSTLPTATPSPTAIVATTMPVAPTLASGEPLLITQASPAKALAWSRDGAQCWTGDATGVVRIWNAATGTLVKELPAAGGGVTSLAFTDDGKRLAAACDDGTVLFVQAVDHKTQTATINGLGRITALAWRYEHPQLLVGDEAGVVVLCNVQPDGTVRTASRDFAGGGSVRHISRNRQLSGPHFAVSYAGGTTAVWTADNPSPDRVLLSAAKQHWNSIQDLFIQTPSVRGGKASYIPTRQSEAFATAWSAQGGELALAGGDVETWGLTGSRGAVRSRLLPGFGAVKGFLCVDWSSDGRSLAAGDATGRLCVWDVSPGGTRQQVGQSLTQKITHVAWAPGTPRRLAAVCDDGRVRIWKVDELVGPGPYFDVESVLVEGDRFAQSEDGEKLYRAVSLLQTQNLIQSQELRCDAWRNKLKAAAFRTHAELAAQKPAETFLLDALLSLQDVVDWNPDAKTVGEARRKLEFNFPMPAPAKLVD